MNNMISLLWYLKLNPLPRTQFPRRVNYFKPFLRCSDEEEGGGAQYCGCHYHCGTTTMTITLLLRSCWSCSCCCCCCEHFDDCPCPRCHHDDSEKNSGVMAFKMKPERPEVSRKSTQPQAGRSQAVFKAPNTYYPMVPGSQHRQAAGPCGEHPTA